MVYSFIILDLTIFKGGDGTFLRSSGSIVNCNIPILGLNTDPSRSSGHLCNKKVRYEEKDKIIPSILENLDKGNFEYFYRQRLNFHMEDQKTGEKIDRLVLNEIFAAEIDVGKASTYRLEVNEKDIGRFKSSGVIISTGTGSSGWLFSARRIT